MKTVILSILVFAVLFGIFALLLSKTKKDARSLTYAALFAALTAVGAFLRVPLPIVPFTMQVFFVIFSGIFLGSKLGLLSQLVYILIGLIGIPVFTKGGGIGYIFQPSFGYLIGFILAAFMAGFIVEKLKKNNFQTYFIASLASIAVIYLCGVPYLYMINSVYLTKAFTFKMAMYYGFIITIPGDLVSVIILCAIAPAIVRVASLKNLIKTS